MKLMVGDWIRRLLWSVCEIGAGVAVGLALFHTVGGLVTALVWCAVTASIIGYVEGQQDL